MKIKFILRLLTTLCFISGCGRDLMIDEPQRKPIQLNENISALSIDLNEFSSFATTFSMFFLPAQDELTWKSDLYKKNEKYDIKIAKIMSHIIKNSDEFDSYDQKILDLNKVKLPLTQKYEDLECDFDYTDECEQIDNQLRDINLKSFVPLTRKDGSTEMVDFETYKSFLIEEIQSSVDDYNRENPETNRPRNWMLYGDAPLYELRRLEDGSIKITFPNLGPFESQNFYSSESGEVFDISEEGAEYNSKIKLLKFKIKEKGSSQNFTGNVWEFSLEPSFVVGKLRYKGDVLTRNSRGEIIRRGICKIDFAKKGS
jgi:hypothetical protein